MNEEYDPDAILADPHAHPKHAEIAAINVRIRDYGEQWSKCANCGEPYRITEEWASLTVCSETCGTEYSAYLTGEL